MHGRNTIKRELWCLMLAAALLLNLAAGTMGKRAEAEQAIYGYTISKLPTRKGPGTQYEDGGTYSVKGQWIRVLSRAWDSRNKIWWVKCEIPYKKAIRVLWTGYKRFDPNTLVLEDIPIEGESGHTSSGNSSGSASTGNTSAAANWYQTYFNFVRSGQYRNYLKNSNREYDQLLRERDTQWDRFTVFDMNGDGVSELLVKTEYALEQVDFFTIRENGIVWLGSLGGDNFFQMVFHYPGNNDILAALGGPVMDIRRASYTGSGFQAQKIARTTVDSSGDYTTGIQMYVSDQNLYNQLYGSFVSGQGNEIELYWTSASEF